ncbi:hypothetical protein V2J09_015413 [Rumex salicifolius]
MKTPLKEHQPHSLVKKILPFAIYAILSLALFRFFFGPSPPLSSSLSPSDRFPSSYSSSLSPPASDPPPPPPPPSSPPPVLVKEEKTLEEIRPCDYTNGTWVANQVGPLYNGTSCGSIKDGQNCMSHGKTELGYLFWRWKPNQCNLPRFDPSKFLDLLRDKHLAFIGDSMARNQLESLVCMLSSAYPPNLVYTNGPDNKFRRWHFPSHNVNVSVYWSPFLVKGVEKSISGPNHNKLYFDSVDERWGSDLGWIDMVVLSIGHWYLHPAVYFEGDSVLGCHACNGMNHTEIGFFEVFRKAYRTALKAIVERKSAIDVFLTTFSPSHFEGEWDKAAACPKTKPYKEGEKELEWMDAEMRKIGLEEVELAKKSVNSGKIKINALDITKLAILRPDSHPGPYMHPFPFANGVPERVQNDCLHWCLPGAIDTWNEIMLEYH